MSPARVLLVCSDPVGLAFLAGVLSEQYAVLAAETPEKALRLIARHGPCGAAFCEVFDAPETARSFLEDLARANPGIAVIALTPQPCPDSVMHALAEDRIAGICLLPLTAQTLREKARHALSRSRGGLECLDAPLGVLTREEVDFLLGRLDYESEQSPSLTH